LNHHASPRFWALYEALPSDIRDLAEKPVTEPLQYRALGLPVDDGVYWFWIGTHADYDKMVG